MEITLSILLAAVLFTANVYTTEPLEDNGDGTFTAAVLCYPDLSIIVPSESPYFVHLGTFLPGTYYEINLVPLNKIIKWRLSGNAKKHDGSWMDYHCWSVNGNFSNAYFGIDAKWYFDYTDSPLPGSGNFDHPNVHLITEGAGFCEDDAYFTIKALYITVSASAPAGAYIEIPITVYVSVSI